MTNEELIAKIKAEIERRIKECEATYPKDKGGYWFPEQEEAYAIAEEYKQLLSFIDTLEEPDKCKGCNNVKGCIACVDGDQWAHNEEPVCEELEDELERFIASGKSVTVDDYGTYKVSYHDFKKVARHFAEWGRSKVIVKGFLKVQRFSERKIIS